MSPWNLSVFERRSNGIWNNVGFPCLWPCSTPMSFMFSPARPRLVLAGWDATSSPYRDKTFADYVVAAHNCEHWRIINKRQFLKLKKDFLAYDKRTSQNSSRGLALVADFPELELKKGDRVEHVLNTIDAQGFFDLTDFPATVCFWRISRETLTHHRNPLFSEHTGITPQRSTALDYLHVLSLGVFQTHVSYTTHRLLQVDAWSSMDNNMNSRMVTSMSRLGADLETWQKLQKSRGRDVTMCYLKPEAFGTADRPRCFLKGAQTNWYLEYLVNVLLPSRTHLLGGDTARISRAGHCLFRLLSLIREHTFIFPSRPFNNFTIKLGAIWT